MSSTLRLAASLAFLVIASTAVADWGPNGTGLATPRPSATQSREGSTRHGASLGPAKPGAARSGEDWGGNGRAVNAAPAVSSARLTKIKLAR